eukprot:UN12455
MIGDKTLTENEYSALWPERPIDMKNVYTEYYRTCESLTNDLLYALTLVLKVRADYFDDYLIKT